MSITLFIKSLRSISLVAFIVVFGISQTAMALTPEQRGLLKAGIPYFNLDEGAVCGGAAGAVNGNGTVTTDLASFIDAYGQFAFNVGKRNGLPYDAIIAQASLESGNGQSGLTQEANNFFGIKAGSSWTGATVTKRTAEQNADGSVYYVDAKFEAYPSAEAGFQGYADFLKRNPRYADVFNYQRDSIGYFRALKAAGYATDVQYVDKLTSVLTAVREYITSKNLFPPISEVQYDTQQPATPGAPGASGGCAATPAGDASAVVAIAIREAQNWTNTAGAYKKYTMGRAENWCADFVSWVYKEAGRPFTETPGVSMIDGWQIPAVSSLRTYLQTRGQYFEKSAAQPPQPGDIVIYKNGASHTNIVVEANGFMVKTVGGNQGSAGGQGAFFESSDVTMSSSAYDIRNDSTVSGWGRLP